MTTKKIIKQETLNAALEKLQSAAQVAFDDAKHPALPHLLIDAAIAIGKAARVQTPQGKEVVIGVLKPAWRLIRNTCAAQTKAAVEEYIKIVLTTANKDIDAILASWDNALHTLPEEEKEEVSWKWVEALDSYYILIHPDSVLENDERWELKRKYERLSLQIEVRLSVARFYGNVWQRMKQYAKAAGIPTNDWHYGVWCVVKNDEIMIDK